MCKSPRTPGCSSLIVAHLRCGSAHPSCRTAGPASLPELTELFCKLLTSGGPIVTDVIAQLKDMAFKVKLVLLKPRDVEFFAGRAALELTVDVLFIVSHDPGRK